MVRDFQPKSRASQPGKLTDPLPDALCQKLPPQAIDRYFFPDEQNSLEAHFGRAICRRCPEIAGCWADALADPPEYGTRAAQDASTIRAIAQRMVDATGFATVDQLPPELLHPQYERLVVKHLTSRRVTSVPAGAYERPRLHVVR